MKEKTVGRHALKALAFYSYGLSIKMQIKGDNNESGSWPRLGTK